MCNALESTSAFGPATSTILTPHNPLSSQDISQYNDYFHASCYLALGMIYLKDNPLLREPLQPHHLKQRLLGHFGSAPGQIFTYMHFNRVIKKYDLDAYFVSGPGHGAPAVLSQSFLEGVYSEVYPEKSQDVDGLRVFFKKFSFPGGIGSHTTPETPGSIHEGGELGYSISHAFGSVFDNPNLIALTVVGDGEAETGPLATSWHSNKFLNPVTDGAVLPVLHLNGYKINNPTILARIPNDELEKLFLGYGWQPYFVQGDELSSMHQAMARTMDRCVDEIRAIQAASRTTDSPSRPRWPMIILRSPKGWTAPRKIGDDYFAGFWRSHQVPITDPATNPSHLAILESWMRSYEPERLFGKQGKPLASITALCPEGDRRMSRNSITNGGLLLKPLKLPVFKEYQIQVDRPGATINASMHNFGRYLRDVIGANPHNFRLFGPDETESNNLGAVYEVTNKVWMGQILEEDSNGGHLAREGRVMEMLSEHTCEGWLEGYILSGRHGLLNCYEAFIHLVDSMVNQHCKWLEKSLEVDWRVKIASLNILLTAVVWRQDHNGFTHQDPGFLDLIANKSPDVVRIYLPPDGNCLLSVMDHCLRSKNYVNVIVSDKKEHLQYLDMNSAIVHCTKGIGIWPQFSTDSGQRPDLVMACCGDVSTQESLAATQYLLDEYPRLKIRFINCVDVFRLLHPSDHSHGMTDSEWVNLFTNNTPIIFNFHGYPALVHRLSYKRPGSEHLHVHGYREKGNIDTPLLLAIRNETDRFSLALQALDLIPGLGSTCAHVRQSFLHRRISACQEAFETGIDPPELTNWKWTWEQTMEDN
ncbi:Putative Phosphoketolase [[Torrubiella] hemipterigena]|uniref:Putative Phosphoketolase n=1 Tax=[Torrubiella] hemipterigena TaxID=1531966 RepID=A0A0A1TJT6_9HYPO|nr:Putative Phosphoketolase [[Torrubiella] hemipterigena]